MKSRTKKRLAALGAVLVVCAGGAVALQQVRAVRRAAGIQRALERGLAAYDRADWHETLELLGYYINRAKSPTPVALYRWADARQRLPEDDLSHISSALRVAIDAVAADPGDHDARVLLVDLYARAGRPAEALATLDRALATRPNDLDLLEQRADLLTALNRWTDARRACLDLIRSFPGDLDAHRRYLLVVLQEDASDAHRTLRAHLDSLEALPLSDADRAAIRADYSLAMNDLEGVWSACRAGVAAGLTSGAQVEIILDALDVLMGLRENRGEVSGLIEQVEHAALAMAPIPQDVGVALVSRSVRLGTARRVEQALPGVVESPADASIEALGWALVAGRPGATWIAQARAALSPRTGDTAEFWRAIDRASLALAARDPAAIDAAREAVTLASTLDADRRDERLLAGFLAAGADEARGALALAERGFAGVATGTRWRVARAAHLSLLLDRGAYTEALGALEASRASDPQFVSTGPGLLIHAAALINLAERSTEPTPDVAAAVQILDFILQAGPAPDAQVLGLQARARAAWGDLPGATLAVDRMLALGDALGVDVAVRTGSALRARAPQLASRLIDEAQRRDPTSPDLLYDRALAAYTQGRGDEADRILAQGIAGASDESRLRLRLLRVRLLGAAGDPGALSALAALAAEYPDELEVQMTVLDSPQAWNDQTLIQGAIARARAIGGEESEGWRLAEARRLLTFGPTPQRAGEALSGPLDPLLRAGREPRAFELAASAWMLLGQRAEAIKSLERALASSPGRAALYPRLITLLVQDGRADQARERMRAFASEPGVSAQTARQRAALLEVLGLWDEAIDERTALADRGGPADRLALATLLTRAGRLERAGALLDRLLASEEPTPDLIAAAATLRALRGDVVGGRELFDRLRGVVPESSRVLLIADYLRSAGHESDARDAVRAHVQGPGAGDPEAWLWLARTSFESGNADEGRAAIERGLEARPDFAPLVALRRLEQEGVRDPALLAALSSDSAEAGTDPVLMEFNELLLAFSRDRLTTPAFEQRLVDLTTRHPLFARAWRVLVRLRAATGDLPGAARAALDAVRVIPSDPRPARDAVDVLVAAGRLDDALTAARTWRDRSPADPMPADLAIAELQLVLGRPGDAAAVLAPWLDQILGMESPTPMQAGVTARVLAATMPEGVLDRLASLASTSQAWARACVAAAADVRQPADRRAWLERLGGGSDRAPVDALALATQWRLLGEASGSTDDLQIALDLGGSPDWGAAAGSAALHRGLVLRRLGRFEQAAHEFESVIGLDPALARQGRTALVLMVIEDAPHLAPGCVEPARALWNEVRLDTALEPESRALAGDAVARLLLLAGAPRDALGVVDAALAMTPLDPGLCGRKVQAILAAGDRAAAQAAIDLMPTRDAQVRTMLAAAAYVGQTNPSDVEWLYRRALALNRDNYLVSNNLAYHLLTSGGRPEEAVELARQALSSVQARDPRPDLVANVSETLGSALLAADQPADAERAFREALRLQPGNGALLLGLAESLQRLGRADEAQEALGRIDPEGRDELSDAQRARYERLSSALDQ